MSQVTGPMIGVPNRAITEEYNCLRLDHCKGCAVTYTHGEGHCGLHKVNFSILQKLCISDTRCIQFALGSCYAVHINASSI